MFYYSFLILISYVCCAICFKVEQITLPLHLSEGPHWDERQQALYFVSVGEISGIHKYVPATGVHTKTKIGK